MYYIGIDPGKNGGIAYIHEEITKNTHRYTAYTEPYSDDNLLNTLKYIDYFTPDKYQVKCVLEKVNAMPNQGVVSMFNFGQNYGFIQGVLKAYKIPFELVPPAKWKKEFSVTADKNTSIDVASRLYDVNLYASKRCRKKHDGMAEALLMAEYARRNL